MIDADVKFLRQFMCPCCLISPNPRVVLFVSFMSWRPWLTESRGVKQSVDLQWILLMPKSDVTEKWAQMPEELRIPVVLSERAN